MEWDNLRTIGYMDLGDKITHSLFASVMTRSGGFNLVDQNHMDSTTMLLSDALMFAGGGSASTAGGIKVTTIAVMFLAIVAEARGDSDVKIYGRTIPQGTMRVAISVIVAGATLVSVSAVLLLHISGASLDRVLFETISAFATVGLSTNLSAELPPSGVYVLSALMFAGPRRHRHPCRRPGPAPAQPAVPLPGREADHWLDSSGAVNRPAHNAPVLVIGLGRFGASTADQLVKQGREVLAIERDRTLVQKWAGVLTHVVEADATNIDALRQLGAQDFSSAVVGVGTSIESSVLITVNLVDLGIEHLWVKAITPSHGKILTRIGANHVIYPEADAGVRAAHLVSGRMLDFIEFDDDFAIVKMYPPRETVGFTLDESKVRSKYGVTMVGVKSPGEDFTYARPDTKVSRGTC